MDEQDELIQVAMKIILNAGDARNYINDALKFAKKFDFDQAEKEIKKANDSIRLAHKSQTEIVQKEMSGEKHGYSILFAHAQDTLMTIMSEINMSTEMIEILKIIKNNSK